MTLFTISDVQKRIQDILKVTDDPEAAHSIEDKLYEDLLRAIAEDRCVNAKACAALAITTQDISFDRWCA